MGAKLRETIDFFLRNEKKCREALGTRNERDEGAKKARKINE